jgi:hypothetical protein
MAAVAVVACVFWASLLVHRRWQYQRIARDHAAAHQRYIWTYGWFTPFDKIEWHDKMRVKYEYAAAHPWLPVEPDPHEPQ